MQNTQRIPRERMVKNQLIARGIIDKNVLNAMLTVPRHLFVPNTLEALAYADAPQPIGYGQTISQPYIVALMTELLQLEPKMRVLEIGTGSGYQSAVLYTMGAKVFTVERIEELHYATKKLFHSLNYTGILTKLDDGTLGWKEFAPYDRIIATAGGTTVPETLIDQLADPGILVLPVKIKANDERLIIIRKKDGKLSQEYSKSVSFVDLISGNIERKK